MAKIAGVIGHSTFRCALAQPVPMKFPVPYVLVAMSVAHAAESKPLFDGKTLAGWNGDTNNIWRVADGEIVGGALDKTVPRNEFLATDRAYTNFVVKLQFKLRGSEGFVNSGLQIRSTRVPNDSEMAGYQADIGEGWYGCIYDESRRNKVLARPEAAAVKKALKQGEWNDYEVRAEGKRVRIVLNGVPMVDYSEPDDSIRQSGVLGLQIHGGGKTEVRFRNLEITELP